MVASGMGMGERIHFYFCPTFSSGLAYVAMIWMEESGTTFTANAKDVHQYFGFLNLGHEVQTSGFRGAVRGT